MAFTKVYAKILAGMLDEDAQIAMRVLCGKSKHASNIPEATVDELIALELAKKSENFDGKALLLLTSRGKKVAEFV